MPGVAACTGCHESVKFYPNAAATSAHQTFAVAVDGICTNCHTQASILAQHEDPGQADADAFNIGPSWTARSRPSRSPR